MAESKNARIKVKSRCHLVVDGVGHLWPDDSEGVNRKAGRRVEAEVDETALKRYGKNLIRVGKAAPEPEDKQIKGSETK